MYQFIVVIVNMVGEESLNCLLLSGPFNRFVHNCNFISVTDAKDGWRGQAPLLPFPKGSRGVRSTLH